MKPFFSIIISCCNVERHIGECLQSILDQPFQDWECLAVVETSLDQTEQIVRAFAKKEPRIRVFTQPRSGSPSAPRNTGLDHAQGEYVIFVDGDDQIRENKLEELAERISKKPGADLYPCALFVHDTRTNKKETWDNYPQDSPAELNAPEATGYMQRVSPFCPMAQMTVCRLEFLNREHLRFAYGLKYEDVEFGPRAFCLAKRIAPLHIPFYLYFIHPGSITTGKRHPDMRHYARVYRNLFRFHAGVSKTPGFDPRLSRFWANQWIAFILGRWFFPWTIRTIPRKERLATLRYMFADNQENFRILVKYTSSAKRLASRIMLLPVNHPAWTIGIVDSFFHLYFFFSSFKAKKPSSRQSVY